jgi:hypothetical protein
MEQKKVVCENSIQNSIAQPWDYLAIHKNVKWLINYTRGSNGNNIIDYRFTIII